MVVQGVHLQQQVFCRYDTRDFAAGFEWEWSAKYECTEVYLGFFFSFNAINDSQKVNKRRQYTIVILVLGLDSQECVLIAGSLKTVSRNEQRNNSSG